MSLVSLARISKWAREPGARPPAAGLDDAALAAFVSQVLRRLPAPWRYTCLRRSVVLYHLLRRAGRAVSLTIGVRKGGAGDLQAHAWLVLDGVPYLEPDRDEHRAFAVVASFPENVQRARG